LLSEVLRQARKLQAASNFLKLKRKHLALREAMLQHGSLDAFENFLPADVVEDPAVKVMTNK
jgi:hypothetical protein